MGRRGHRTSRFWALWRERPVVAPAEGEPDGEGARACPPVPATDFLTFRADAQRSLTPCEFAEVDRLYRSAFTDSRAGLGRTEESVARHIHGALSSAGDANGRTVVLRAIQAAAFAAGMLIEVDVGAVFRAVASSRLLRLDNEDWQKVASATQPRYSAIATLAVTGLTAQECHDLSGSDVADDGSAVSVGGRLREVPEPGRRCLVAQHIVRRLFGYQPTDPYLADGSRQAVRAIAKVLNMMTEQLGVPLRMRYSRDKSSRRWQYRWGVRIKPLDSHT